MNALPRESQTTPIEEVPSAECVRDALVTRRRDRAAAATARGLHPSASAHRCARVPSHLARREHDTARPVRRRQRALGVHLDMRTTAAEGNAASLVAHLDSRAAAVVRKTAPHRESSDSVASAELDLGGP